ncbi:HAD-IA family hydrolase [Nocardioides acrostichi]|uniref:HAD-IA family hydrolase n=1 Tax=Nocardioides acrostichi TaxID=2784339 RepID=A0A930UXY4_9ACTN|nr:HAD-IA family hydrolase [Nocardioides acrostichi]MBF4162928.1 HAD-IA family hydrolase [Nocardioides acrostichi]
MRGDSTRSATPDTSVSGVVWDLGNVIVDWQPRFAVAAGVGEAEAARFLAADDLDFRAYNHGPDSGQSWDDAEAALAISHPHWLEHARAYRRHFEESLRGEVPGTGALLRELDTAGVPQWGLTNWSDELYHRYAPRAYPVLALLREVVVSGTEGVAKPDRAAYDLTVARTGRPASSLVFVDDRADNVEAARDAGLHGVVFTDAATLRLELRGLGLPV